MSAPFYRHTLGISSALARSGVKGGTIPGFSQDVQQVVILADFSSSYSGSPVEGRALAASQLLIGIGNRGFIEFSSQAQGGCVFESVSVFFSGSGGNVFLDVTTVPVIPFGATIPLLKVDTGGTPTFSTGILGATNDVPTGVGPIDLSVFGAAFPLARIYTPPGSFLRMISDAVGPLFIECALHWREIPTGIGVA